MTSFFPVFYKFITRGATQLVVQLTSLSSLIIPLVTKCIVAEARHLSEPY